MGAVTAQVSDDGLEAVRSRSRRLRAAASTPALRLAERLQNAKGQCAVNRCCCALALGDKASAN